MSREDPDRYQEGGRSPPGENGNPLTDLTEALTALGNYLAAACHVVADPASGPDQLADVLEKALEQHSRSAVALRRIRAYNVLNNAHPSQTSC